ncbi:hypothetical protein [Bradyrhizobium liaoningense]
MVDGVAKGIGDAFDFLQLDAIIYRCTGEHRINGWTNDKLPRWMIARNCIDGAEKQGLIVRFLAYILSSLPPAGTLHVLIVNAMPQAKDALPEVKPQVEEVRLGLERTRELLNGPRRPIDDRGVPRDTDRRGEGNLPSRRLQGSARLPAQSAGQTDIAADRVVRENRFGQPSTRRAAGIQGPGQNTGAMRPRCRG